MSIDYTKHQRNIADFLNSLDSGSYPLDGAERHKEIEIIEAIYEPAEIVRPVRISECRRYEMK